MKEKDIITLEDNKRYIVSAKINYEEKDYYYIQDVENIENIKFCEHEKSDNSMIILDDPDLFDILLPLFGKRAEELLKESTEQN